MASRAGRCGPRWPAPGELGPQLTAFFTSASIRASSAAVNSVRAKDTGHMAPSSSLASAWNSNVAYRTLNFEAGLKKQKT